MSPKISQFLGLFPTYCHKSIISVLDIIEMKADVMSFQAGEQDDTIFMLSNIIPAILLSALLQWTQGIN